MLTDAKVTASVTWPGEMDIPEPVLESLIGVQTAHRIL